MVKFNNKTKLIIAFLIISLSLGILIFFVNPKDNKFNFSQTTISAPDPNTNNPTSFVSHPQIIKSQQELEQIQSTINQLEINHHPLLPPNLDMDVNLER